MRIFRLPYYPDSSQIFGAIAREPWAVFLDSGRPAATGGRWDILASRPYITFQSRQQHTEIRSRHGVQMLTGDPLALLRAGLGERTPTGDDWPFTGGAIGYFAYDLARTRGLLPSGPSTGVPEMAVGLYDWAVLVDHERGETTLVSEGRAPETAQIWDELIHLFSTPPSKERGSFKVKSPALPNFSRAQYEAAFSRIRRYIYSGDCYQINLTQRYSSQIEGDRWALYNALRNVNPAPHAAWLNFPEAQVMSSSPERFVALRSGRASTRPIKGTRPRSDDPELDAQLARALADSEKDRAENLMIADLLRNDFGKVCRPGSVQVPELFAVESFAHVHHLVSTVSGELGEGQDALSLLDAVFPGGSITGAPKLRAMAIIDEIEPDPRGIYCGAIGYIGYNGDMDTSIAIRTLVGQGDTVSFGVGGGIVADSRVEDEYKECLDKAAPLLELLRFDR
jgi:para-aminobenzoate synthetase component 1